MSRPLAPTVRLRYQRTPSGRPLVIFVDTLRQTGSLADSATAPDCVWLGIDGAPRLHLDRATVAALLPLLTAFVERGTIREDGDRR